MRKLFVDRNQAESIAIDTGILNLLRKLERHDAVLFRNNLERFNLVKMLSTIFNAISYIFQTDALTQTIGIYHGLNVKRLAGSSIQRAVSLEVDYLHAIPCIDKLIFPANKGEINVYSIYR